MEIREEKSFEMLQKLVKVTNKLDTAFCNMLHHNESGLDGDKYEALMDELIEVENFIHINGGVKDKNGEVVRLGDKLKLDHIVDEGFDIYEFTKDEEGMACFKNLEDGVLFDVHFLGSSELVLIKEENNSNE